MKVLNKVWIIGLMILGFAFPCYAEKIVIEGSTTVLPIAQKAAEVFMNNNPGTQISRMNSESSRGYLDYGVFPILI